VNASKQKEASDMFHSLSSSMQFRKDLIGATSKMMTRAGNNTIMMTMIEEQQKLLKGTNRFNGPRLPSPSHKLISLFCLICLREKGTWCVSSFAVSFGLSYLTLRLPWLNMPNINQYLKIRWVKTSCQQQMENHTSFDKVAGGMIRSMCSNTHVVQVIVEEEQDWLWSMSHRILTLQPLNKTSALARRNII
jgi:hypothetical protein